MDAVATYTDPPPAYAATDERPRGPRETELCEKASTFDWLYFSIPMAALVGSITADALVFKYPGNRNPDTADHSTPYVFTGSALVGFSWGWALGSLVPSLPQCSPLWVPSAPPEGNVRTSLYLSIAFTMLAAVTAPVIVGTEQGPTPYWWTYSERSARLYLAAGAGVLGALVPYVLPPRTWSASRELMRLRAGPTADGRGGSIGYAFTF